MPNIADVHTQLSTNAQQEYANLLANWMRMNLEQQMDSIEEIFIGQKVNQFLCSEVSDFYAAQIFLLDNPFKEIARELKCLLENSNDQVAGSHMESILSTPATNHPLEDVLAKYETAEQYEAIIGDTLYDGSEEQKQAEVKLDAQHQ